MFPCNGSFLCELSSGRHHSCCGGHFRTYATEAEDYGANKAAPAPGCSGVDAEDCSFARDRLQDCPLELRPQDVGLVSVRHPPILAARIGVSFGDGETLCACLGGKCSRFCRCDCVLIHAYGCATACSRTATPGAGALPF